jgi:type I restriction enzyme M protein
MSPADWLFSTHGDVADSRRRALDYFSTQATYEGSEYQIEEFVRQWALRQILDAYKYPSDWIGERIIVEEPVKMGSTEKEADISIKNANRRTFLYVEVKKRGVTADEFTEAERQLETYLASTHTATIGMVTDGDRVKTIRKKIEPNDFEYIPDLPHFGLEAKVKTQLIRELPDDLGEGKSTGLKIFNNDYERILFDCHSAARDADGLHADEALDEICKVIYAKIFDERSVTKQAEGTPFRFQTYGASNSSEVASNSRCGGGLFATTLAAGSNRFHASGCSSISFAEGDFTIIEKRPYEVLSQERRHYLEVSSPSYSPEGA